MKDKIVTLKPFLARRRVLRLLAATSVAGLAVAADALSDSQVVDASLHRWQGTALGADSTLLIHHPDAAEATRLTLLAIDEIARLEKVYSLKHPDSILVRLNRKGQIRNPPTELVALLLRARRWSKITGGAFDVTVQPLWELYRQHFSEPGSDLQGPPEALLAEARELVNFQALDVSPEHIRLTRPGMAITLNGIAQGEITDRVANLLRAEGLTNSLIDLGEMRALDGYPDERPWRVGIKHPYDSDALISRVNLADQAMATSSVTGTAFDSSGIHHHLFDPKSGRPSRGLISASVIARQAADADAFSTALLTAREPLSPAIGLSMGVEQVITVDDEGAVVNWKAESGSAVDSPKVLT